MPDICPLCSCARHDPDGPWRWTICPLPDCHCLRVNDALGRPVPAPHLREAEQGELKWSLPTEYSRR